MSSLLSALWSSRCLATTTISSIAIYLLMRLPTSTPCAVCDRSNPGFNAVPLPCGHICCAHCVMDSESERQIKCKLCQEAFYRRQNPLPSRGRDVFLEAKSDAHLQDQIITLQRALEEEKQSRKDFESDLLRQLLRITSKDEEKSQREIEALQEQIDELTDDVSAYRQSLEETREKLAGVEKRCAELEKEVVGTKARGDDEIARLQEGLRELKRRDANRQARLDQAGSSVDRHIKVEPTIQLAEAAHPAPRVSRARLHVKREPSPEPKPFVEVKQEEPLSFGRESRQAVHTDGRRGRVFKFKGVAPPADEGPRYETDTESDSDSELADVKPIVPERPIRCLPSHRLPASGKPATEVPAKVAEVKHPVAPPPVPVVKTRELKRGDEIKWRGYGRPQFTAVPECTVMSGVHSFSGSGTNQHMRKFTCSGCGFSCQERWR